MKQLKTKEKILIIIAITLVAIIIPFGTIYAIKSNNSHKTNRKNIEVLGDQAIVPWILWGNSAEDSTNIFSRTFSAMKGW